MKSVLERYQYKPATGSSHWCATMKLDQIGSVSTALDVGPGSGIFSTLLNERGTHTIDAIEIDADTRARLKDQYRTIVASIEELDSEQYELVLCLDVLEHMSEPFLFLETLTTHLAPGAHLLISLPNIAHWSVRFQLLFGLFEYTDRGLLDKTHLQFFTKKRARQLGAATGGKISSYNCSIEPVELLLPEAIGQSKPFNAVSSLRYSAAQILPGLLGYQHLLHVRK